MSAIQRRRLAVPGLLAVAVLQDDLRRAFHQKDLLAVGVPVQRCHEAVLGFERNGVDPRIRALLGLPVHPELGRERVEGALGRIALDRPDALALEQLRIVAEQRHAAQQLEHRILARGRAVLLDLALGRVAVAGDLVSCLGGGGRHDHHLHQGQRAGLVGADARHRAEGLHRGQAPDDGVALGHPLHADRERDRDDRRQALRNHRHRDARHRLEELHESHALHPPAVGEDQDARHPDHGGDGVAELLDLAQQRRLERADAGEQLVDAAQLRLAAGPDHHARGAAGDDHGAGEHHAFAIPDRRLLGDRIGGLVRGHQLAGERRFLGPQVLDIGEPEVGRHLVAQFEQHDVARHELIRRQHARRAAAQGPRFGRQHVADRIQRLLRSPLLDEPEQPVDDDDAQNDRGVDPQAQHHLGEARAKQHVDQDVVELGDEPHERPALPAFRQAVGPVLLQAGGGFAGIQAVLGAGGEPPQHLIDGDGVPGGTVSRGLGAHCSGHPLLPVAFDPPRCPKGGRSGPLGSEASAQKHSDALPTSRHSKIGRQDL